MAEDRRKLIVDSEGETLRPYEGVLSEPRDPSTSPGPPSVRRLVGDMDCRGHHRPWSHSAQPDVWLVVGDMDCRGRHGLSARCIVCGAAPPVVARGVDISGNSGYFGRYEKTSHHSVLSCLKLSGAPTPYSESLPSNRWHDNPSGHSDWLRFPAIPGSRIMKDAQLRLNLTQHGTTHQARTP